MSGSEIPQPGPNTLGNEDILMPLAVRSSDLSSIRRKYQVAPEIGFLLPPPLATADTLVEGYCCMYEVWLESCELRFQIHPLLFDFVEALGLTLPQMCPNFVRMVMGLLVVSHEQKVDLALTDLVRLCVVKANSKHDPQVFLSFEGRGSRSDLWFLFER